MTKEQAIEKCEELIKPEHTNWIGLSNQNAIETALNMLKEKDKEIEKLKKENEHWKNGFERELEDNRENTCELLKQDLIIRKKDKQIDLMAEEINNSFLNTCPYIDYEIDLDCENRCNDDYKECWKQYFKNKAEKE